MLSIYLENALEFKIYFKLFCNFKGGEMTQLNQAEQVVLRAFRVTGFFGKTPKRNVSRKSSGVWRSVQASGDELSLDEIASAIEGLVQKGLLRFDQDVAFLSDAGYEEILNQ